MQKILIFICVCLFLSCSKTQENPLATVLEGGSSQFKKTLANDRHEIQIIYGEIKGDSIIHHSHGLKPDTYFYPASTVKMPVAFAAVKKAEEMGISLDSRLIIDSTAIYPINKVYDSLFTDSIRISSLIKKIFTVSDNEAYNILYGWLGKDYINKVYHDLGLDTKIVHQLSESAFYFSPSSNTYSRKTQVITPSNDTIYQEEQQQKYDSFTQRVGERKGLGYIDSTGQLINEPFAFSGKNFIGLEDLLTILEMALRPDLFAGKESFSFSLEMQEQILDLTSLLPQDLPAPYDSLSDNYVKFLMFGNDTEKEMPDHIQIRNKVGWAYGYLLDVAYITDSENDVSFFLAAVIHVNENQIYNDGNYEYEEVGLPFLDELGDLIYAHERAK